MATNDDTSLVKALDFLKKDPHFSQKLRTNIDDLVSETRQYHGTAEVAYELDKQEKEMLTRVIEKILRKKLDIYYRVNTSLLGGFRIKVGDWKYDASLLGQLDSLKEMVTNHD